MSFPDRFKDKVVVVTGATSGIGHAVAVRAALEGAKVVCVGRNEQRGNAVVQTIKDNKIGDGIFVQADVSKADEVKRVFDTTIKTFGKLDVVINNAGVIMDQLKNITEVSDEEFHRIISINLDSVFFAVREAGRIFKEQGTGGSIVNISSAAGLVAQKNLSAYVTSKHAVNGLTKAAAYDLAQYNVRVNSVCPGGVETPMTTSGGLDFAGIAKSRGMTVPELMLDLFGQKNSSMQGGMAKPEEQAATILYFASDEAKHITGSLIAADGGYTCF